jgi:hypothetical protein
MLGEEQISIHHDIEHAPVASNQSGFDAELSLDLGRQTGGPRVVVSNSAVCNRDVHARSSTFWRPS